MEQNNFIASLKLNYNTKGYFHIEDLENLLTEENRLIVSMVMNGHIEHVYYLDLLDRGYLKPIDQMVADLECIINEMPDYGEVEDIASILDLLSEILQDMTYEEGLDILKI